MLLPVNLISHKLPAISIEVAEQRALNEVNKSFLVVL